MKTQPPLRAYILGIAIWRNRWHLHLHDVKTGQVLVFDSFGVLRGFLESGITNHPPDG